MSWRDYADADGVAVFHFDAYDDYSSWRLYGDEFAEAVALLGGGWSGDLLSAGDANRLSAALRKLSVSSFAAARCESDDAAALRLFRLGDEADRLSAAVFIPDEAVWQDCDDAALHWWSEVREALEDWCAEFPVVCDDDWYDCHYDGRCLLVVFLWKCARV